MLAFKDSFAMHTGGNRFQALSQRCARGFQVQIKCFNRLNYLHNCLCIAFPLSPFHAQALPLCMQCLMSHDVKPFW
jgi:hypothetical protein